MEANVNRPIAPWIRWSLAIVLPILASIAYLACMSNGIVAGALIGLPGREADVFTAQSHAMIWYTASWIFQCGFVVAIYSLLRFGSDASRFSRYLSRGLVAVLLAFPLTLFVGIVLFGALRLLMPHHPIR